jgi:uncharacterized protein (TIGR03083 family)
VTPEEHIDDLAGAADVLAALAETVAERPPATARADLLAVIGRRPRPSVDPVPPADLYRSRVAALAGLLHTLDDAEWTRPAAPYDWTVHELVAHLVLVEEYTVRQLGLAPEPPVPAGDPAFADHLGLGAAVIPAMTALDPAVTVARWTAATDAILHHLGGAGFDPARPVPLHAWPFDASTALVARAFEIWTHADDVRRATGRALDVPTPGELRTMSSTSVGGLPILLSLGAGPALTATRIVLTGPGGGTFDLGPRADADPDTRNVLVADVVEYCRLVARRVEPDDLSGTRSGDRSVLAALLQAAQAIAV